MSGIVFFRTGDLDRIAAFYREHVNATVWLDQGDCRILAHGGFRFGFCDRETTDDCGIVTFVYDDRAGVDEMYEVVGDAARGEPVENDTYRIYQFFADDPDGRAVEFQTFLHDAE